MRHALLTFQVQFIHHTCSPASLTAGEGLAIQPKIGASRAAVEAVYEGDQWLLTYLTVFSLPYPNWLLCSSFLFASSQSLYLCCLWLRHPAWHLTFLSFFFFSHALPYHFSFSSFFFILRDINPAYFFIVFKNKWKEHNVLSLPWSFFFYIAVSFLSHILCWVLVDCNLFGAEAFLLLFDCTVPSIVCSWISIGLWTLV